MKHLSTIYKVILCKWNWSHATNKDAFWKKVIIHKYGEKDGGWHSKEVVKRYDVSLWKCIRRLGTSSKVEQLF